MSEVRQEKIVSEAIGKEVLPEERVVALPYGFEKVWEVAFLILQRAGWKVTESDKNAGHLMAGKNGYAGASRNILRRPCQS